MQEAERVFVGPMYGEAGCFVADRARPSAVAGWSVPATHCRSAARFLTSGLLIAFICAWLGALESQAAESGTQRYLLDSGDRLKVTVHEWPGFGDEITVAADGTVGLPIVGNLEARGLQTSELADLIAERLRISSNLSGPPSVVVAIAKYRPFFILGDVTTPGEYEFRPGLTVLQAISIAGGYYRIRDPALSRQAITARSELGVNRNEIQRSLVQLARIEAELEGKETFDLPPELKPFAHDPNVIALMATEHGVLRTNLEFHREQIATYEGQSEIARLEIESLEKELKSIDDQSKIVIADAERVRDLASRGLTNAERLSGAELSLARVERTRQELKTAIIRARLTLHREQRKKTELNKEAAKTLRDEQQVVLTRLREARVLQRRSQELIVDAELGANSGLLGARGSKITYDISIVRKTDNGTTQMNAERLDEVKPGDVVTVEKVIPESMITGTTVEQSSSSSFGAAHTATVRP